MDDILKEAIEWAELLKKNESPKGKNQLRIIALADAYRTAENAEATTSALWQDLIYKWATDLVKKHGEPDYRIDGTGSDGDEFAFSLDELQQAQAFLEDRIESANARIVDSNWRAKKASKQLEELLKNIDVVASELREDGHGEREFCPQGYDGCPFCELITMVRRSRLVSDELRSLAPARECVESEDQGTIKQGHYPDRLSALEADNTGLREELKAERKAHAETSQLAEEMQHERDRNATDLMAEQDANAKLKARFERLKAVIRWALGENEEFPVREAGDPPYWWRRELRKRFDAALADEKVE